MKQPTILLIETSTEWCSVSLLENGRISASRITETPKLHASVTAPFAKEVLEERGIRASDCDAVAVSAGPGSYTGLRVGVSTAKGICFGCGKPLIGVETLEILARRGEGRADYIVPMIDARRMEVYCAVFDGRCNRISATEPKILDENSFAEILEKGKVLFIGNGVEKFSRICPGGNAEFESCCPEASWMATPAAEAFAKGEFADTAYFEPFYLKEFVAGISTRSMI